MKKYVNSAERYKGASPDSRRLTARRLPLSAYSMTSVSSVDDAIAPYTDTTLHMVAATSHGEGRPQKDDREEEGYDSAVLLRIFCAGGVH